MSRAPRCPKVVFKIESELDPSVLLDLPLIHEVQRVNTAPATEGSKS
jgi:hypothetical protein